jgi:hypothetical protein
VEADAKVFTIVHPQRSMFADVRLAYPSRTKPLTRLELDARVTAVGKEEGIHFAFDPIERTPTRSMPTGWSGSQAVMAVSGRPIADVLWRYVFRRPKSAGASRQRFSFTVEEKGTADTWR